MTEIKKLKNINRSIYKLISIKMEFRTLGEMQKYLGRMSVPTFHQHLAIYGRGGLGVKDIARRGSGIKDGIISVYTPIEALKKKSLEEINDLIDKNDRFLNTFDSEINPNLETNDVEQDEDGNEYVLDNDGNKFFLSEFKKDDEGEYFVNDEEGNKYTINEAMDLLKKENKNLFQSHEKVELYEHNIRKHLKNLYDDYEKRYSHMEEGPEFLKGVKEAIDIFNSSDNPLHPLLKKEIIKKWDKFTDSQKFKILKGNYSEEKINEIITEINKSLPYEKKKERVVEEIEKFGLMPFEEIEQERQEVMKKLDESINAVVNNVDEEYKDDMDDIYDKLNQSKQFENTENDFNWKNVLMEEGFDKNGKKVLVKKETIEVKLNEAFENLTIGVSINQKKEDILIYKFEKFNDPKYDFLRSIIESLDKERYNQFVGTGKELYVRTYNANFNYVDKKNNKLFSYNKYAPIDNVVEFGIREENKIKILHKYSLEDKLYGDEIDLYKYTTDNDNVLKKFIQVDFIDYDEKIRNYNELKEQLETEYELGDISEKKYNKIKDRIEQKIEEIKKPNETEIETKFNTEFTPYTLNIRRTKTPWNQDKAEYVKGSKSKEKHIKYAKESESMKQNKILEFHEDGNIEKIVSSKGEEWKGMEIYNNSTLLFIVGVAKGVTVGMNFSQQIKDKKIDKDNILRTNILAEDYYSKKNKKTLTANHIGLNIKDFSLIKRI